MPTSKLMLDAVDQLDGTPPAAAATTTTTKPQEHDDDFDVFKEVQQAVVKVTDSVAVVATEAATTAREAQDQLNECCTSRAALHPTRSASEQREADDDSVSGDNNSVTNDEKETNLEKTNESTAAALPAAVTTTDPATGRRRYVSPKDFELLRVIGMGAFGKVLQVRNRQSRQVLAMKVISKRLLRRKGDGMIENIQAERNIMKRVRHPFVVAMHCSFQSREKLFIIMDFLAGGELFLRLGREGIFLEKTAAFYLAEIILALEHLHNLGILHRDLKPENILLGSDGHVCLTDFGLAKDFSGAGGFRENDGSGDDDDDDEARALTICGTQEYMAPEMIARQGYGRAADYWSLGCIAYEMLKGLPPFESKQGAKVLFQKIMTEKVKMPPGSSAEACKLLKGLLNRNVQNRLGAARGTMFEVGGVSGLKKAPFFRHIDWEKLVHKQIDPPAVFAVENDKDVKHFHEEFTKMSLPRSVIEMSKEDFRPRKVESDVFRGFSFIQDDFVLPERKASELQMYWDAPESDAESLSECASSKMDLDENEQKEQAALTETPQQQKKKRPPRKRKKKKNANGSTATTPAGTAANTPTASVANTPAQSAVNTPEPSEAGDDLHEKLEAALHLENESAAVPSPRKSLVVELSSKDSRPKPASPPKPVSLPMPPTVSRGAVATTAPQSKQPQTSAAKTDAWQVTNKKKKNPAQGSAPPSKASTTTTKTPAPPGSSQWMTAKKPQSQSNNNNINRRATNAQPASSNGWSSAPARRQPQPQSRPAPQPVSNSGWNTVPSSRQGGWGASSQQQEQMPPPPPPLASPSSDWRQHAMSPRDAHGRPVIKAPARQPSWPSLGGTAASAAAAASQMKPPPPPVVPAAVTAKPKLAGAWASRGKS